MRYDIVQHTEITSRLNAIQDPELKSLMTELVKYCMVDAKRVYTNGVVFVPMFRVLDFVSAFEQHQENPYYEKA